jgi:DNA-binding CsgD family transcriptional regulator
MNAPLRDEQIDPENKESIRAFVIGSENLINELLQYAIAKEFTCECEIITNIEKIDEDIIHYSKKLFLIDSRDVSFEYVMKYLSTKYKNIDDSYMLALFNLHPGSGVEKKALTKKIKGFFYYNDRLALFLKGIRTVLKGDIWVSRDIILECAISGFQQKIFYIQKQTSLTEREIEILQMIALGAKNEEIADMMCIAPNTVKTHLYNIYKKINVKNRLHAALWAVKYL